jgi:hypothetical protein
MMILCSDSSATTPLQIISFFSDQTIIDKIPRHIGFERADSPSARYQSPAAIIPSTSRMNREGCLGTRRRRVKHTHPGDIDAISCLYRQSICPHRHQMILPKTIPVSR